MTVMPRVLLEGLAIPESPRWYDGRLCFSKRSWNAPKPGAAAGLSEQRPRLGKS
jgi:hypothetical protein